MTYLLTLFTGVLNKILALFATIQDGKGFLKSDSM